MLKLAGPVLATGTMFFAGKIMNRVYEGVTHNTPPSPEDLDVPISRVLIFAVTTSAVTTVIHVAIQRGIAKATQPTLAEIV